MRNAGLAAELRAVADAMARHEAAAGPAEFAAASARLIDLVERLPERVGSAVSRALQTRPGETTAPGEVGP